MDKKIRILNGYSSIGGNRKLWGNDYDITAVELNPERAAIYKEFYPNDEVIVGDAHEYLLQNFSEYDFIWLSPPCQSHSQIRFNLGFKAERKYAKVDAVYPDMSLYQEIILLKHWFNGKWIVENTIPYYEPLPYGHQIVGGHIVWSNFYISPFDIKNRNHRGGTVETLQDRKMLDISKFSIYNKRQILRDCVEPELGLHILDCANLTAEKKGLKREYATQGGLFEVANG